MRLLSLQEGGRPSVTDDTLELPPYAILSHTWGSDNEEVSFQDLKVQNSNKNNSYGYRKIQFCAKQAAEDGLQHFWVDTCCINKESSTELQEAITSMYKWYQNSTRCYVYLPDVQFDSRNPAAWRASFRRSRWFTRCWTLQELLAPSSVEFFDRSGHRLGDKTTLKDMLQDITGISEEALRGCPLYTFTVNERMEWTRGRQAKREEDRAYSLLGIFGISMFLSYGEGEGNAMDRLKTEISRKGAKGSCTRSISTLVVLTLKKADQVTHCLVPYKRNTSFVGRRDILRRLSEVILPSSEPQDCQRIVIHGLGGTGKTQVALEAAYQLREWNSDHSVYWVSAASRRELEKSYREIGKALYLPIVGANKSSKAKTSAPAELRDSLGTSDNGPDLKAAVTAALSRSSTNWLLIIDNLDDPELLSSAKTTGAIHDYLPFNKKGSILITTRNSEVTTKLGVEVDRSFSIDRLTESESLKMFEKRTRPEQMQDEDINKTLLRRLGGLPLAIEQAAAYMARTGITAKQYLESYRLPVTSRTTSSSREPEDRGRNQDSIDTIAQTLFVSSSYMISRHDPLASRYLNLICFLAEKDIPRELFPEEGADSTKTDKSIDVLRKYSFITERFSGDSFDIHPLVRLSTRNSMDAREAESCLGTMAHELSKQYPYAEHENRSICSRYMPHAEAILGVAGTSIDQELRAELLEKVGRTCTQLGKDKIAEVKHYGAWQLRQAVLGPEHSDTLISLHSLAIALKNLGKYEQAEQRYRSVLRLRKKKIGRKHPDTLASEDDLAHVLYLLKEYDEAERLHRNVLKLRQSVLGGDHIDTLHSKNNLALVLGVLGREEESERAHREQQELCEKKFGPMHPETLCSMNNRALMMRELGEYEQARTLFHKCLSLRQKELGSEHPHTLNSLNNLALVLADLGKLEDAEKMHREELQLCEKTLGSGHPDALISMNNLALVLEQAGKYEEAERVSRRAEGLSQKSQVQSDMHGLHVRGLDVPATLSSHIRQDLGTTFSSTSDNDVDHCREVTRPTIVTKHTLTTGQNDGQKSLADVNTRPVSSSISGNNGEKALADKGIELFPSDTSRNDDRKKARADKDTGIVPTDLETTQPTTVNNYIFTTGQNGGQKSTADVNTRPLSSDVNGNDVKTELVSPDASAIDDQKAAADDNTGLVNPEEGNDQLQPPNDMKPNELRAKWSAERVPAYAMKLYSQWTRDLLRGDIGRHLTIGGFIFIIIAILFHNHT